MSVSRAPDAGPGQPVWHLPASLPTGGKRRQVGCRSRCMQGGVRNARILIGLIYAYAWTDNTVGVRFHPRWALVRTWYCCSTVAVLQYCAALRLPSGWCSVRAAHSMFATLLTDGRPCCCSPCVCASMQWHRHTWGGSAAYCGVPTCAMVRRSGGPRAAAGGSCGAPLLPGLTQGQNRYRPWGLLCQPRADNSRT